MDGFALGLLSALWLGILTSISPCPLATNIAAVSFIGNQFDRPRSVFLSSIFYVLGRMVTYTGLGIIIVAGMLAMPDVSIFLQTYMNKILGPVLILTGMFLLELIQIGRFGFQDATKMTDKAGKYGLWGAGFLGILFSLSFCPISAALFFGSLITVAVKYNSGFVMPSIYGIGTGLPVILFAILLAFGARTAGKAMDKLTQFEKHARRITGIIFILIGIYFSVVYIFGIDFL
ncbi:MAG: sulfite exporter TauE/SafE family protein [candidate division Zixibacteria bacterium]|nr:sulfite exporter TauE/SafE family protein [candidate division Zixibacteria bacterium]